MPGLGDSPDGHNINTGVGSEHPAALADDAWLQRTLAAVRKGRAYLERELAGLGCDVVPSQANFVFVDVGVSARELFERLLKRGLIIRPADGWGYPTHVRITVGTPGQNETCISMLATELQTMRGGPA